MAPKKLIVQDLPQPFEAGTIISSQRKMPVSFETLLNELSKVQIIYIGEQHTRPAHHKIQADIIKAIYEIHPQMLIGMEMFDHSYQKILDRWSDGRLDRNTFLKKVHWYANWRYDYRLYKDILDFIKAKNIRLIGLNLPPHIPPKIRVGGIENLSSEERKHLPVEIDISNAAHRKYVEEIYKQHHGRVKNNFEYFYMAQCAWEDTMAEAIARNLKDKPMIVLTGNGHIIKKFGIPERVYQRNRASFLTIYPASAGNTVSLSVGDYIWAAP